MKVRKKTTFTATKFEAGMEDGEIYSHAYKDTFKYKYLTCGGISFVVDEDDCYIVKNDTNGSFELMNKYQLEQYYEEMEGKNENI